MLWFTSPAEAEAPSGLQICYRCLELMVLEKVNLDTVEWILSLSFPIHQLANNCQKYITQIQDFFFSHLFSLINERIDLTFKNIASTFFSFLVRFIITAELVSRTAS